MFKRLVLVSVALVPAWAAPSSFECPPPTPGPQDIKAFGYYTDAAGSIRDEAKFKESHELTKPFEAFADQVAKLSDRYLERGDPAAASCAIAWLDRWAQDRAMLGRMIKVDNDQSEYVRKWTNAAAAIAWNKVRAEASSDQRQRIDSWLQAVSRATLAYWHDHPKSKRNNHYYWTGVGVLATALATGDSELLKQARAVYGTGLQDITDSGGLPLEMRRGVRALSYHNYSLLPLAMMAEMARKTGEDWFSLRGHRLDRLAALVASGLRDPAWFGKEADTGPQVVPSTRDRAWVRIFRAREPQLKTLEGISGPDDSSYVRDLGGSLELILAKGVFDPK